MNRVHIDLLPTIFTSGPIKPWVHFPSLETPFSIALEVPISVRKYGLLGSGHGHDELRASKVIPAFDPKRSGALFIHVVAFRGSIAIVEDADSFGNTAKPAHWCQARIR